MMHELGIDSTQLPAILNGDKTLDLRLGKARFIKLRVGDILQLREDVWKDNEVMYSSPSDVRIVITQLLYFESLREVFSALPFTFALPTTKSAIDAVAYYRQYYHRNDEAEYGVVAIRFKLAE